MKLFLFAVLSNGFSRRFNYCMEQEPDLIGQFKKSDPEQQQPFNQIPASKARLNAIRLHFFLFD
jgi:hypothetical protein